MATNKMTHTTRWAAQVAIRVPCESDRTLAGAAAKRLESTPGIDSASVGQVCGLKPTLSATVVTVEVTVRTDEASTETATESMLRDTPGAEQVQTLHPAQRNG